MTTPSAERMQEIRERLKQAKNSYAGNCITDLRALLSAHDALEADNAALIQHRRDLFKLYGLETSAEETAIEEAPHPGAALLARHAAELAAKDAEIARYQTALGTANATIMGLQDGSLLRDAQMEIARLREGLEPFANAAGFFQPECSDDYRYAEYTTVGDLRRAKELLNAK